MTLEPEKTTYAFPLLIDGQRVAAKSGPTLFDPSTGSPFAESPGADRGDYDTAIGAATRAASGAWASDEAKRVQVLLDIERVLKANARDLSSLLCREIGVPLKAAQLEVTMAAAFIAHRAQAPLPVDTIHKDAKQVVEVLRRPIGVVGAILPWNAPLLILCEKLGTALRVGNTLVVKPSPLAPLTVLRFLELLVDVVPHGVVNAVAGGDEVGAALVSDPRVGMISFTGSVRAGQAIMSAAAPTLKRLSLELGGNDAAVVLPDVDVDRMASRIFWGAFYRSGQICAAIKRVYVHESVAEQMHAALVKQAQACVLGSPMEATTTMGPMSNRAQFERVRGLLADATQAGGIASESPRVPAGDGYFVSPTLITGLDPGHPLVTEEQFGPLLPLVTFADVDEAVAAANHSVYGLGASVWSRDLGVAAEVAGRLQAGSVWVNRHGLVMPEIPFGGFKHSGVGRSNGAVGIDHYAELQTVSVALG